jgi:hypothetical protein
VKQVVLDPQLETADVNTENNYMPRKVIPSRFELFKQQAFGRNGPQNGTNPMQQAKQMEAKGQGKN